MESPTTVPEADLLREALELSPRAGLRLLSREPLGAGSIAGFDVVVDDAVPLTYFVDTSGRPVDRETGLLAGSPDEPEARVWLHPADPHLPALAPVAFAEAAGTLLARLGLTQDGPPAFVAYRPGRRAVVRVATSKGTAWIKVLPPARVERIVDIHRVLLAHGVPIPPIHGWSADGLLVLSDAAGTAVADAVWEPDALLDEVDALRRRIASAPLAHQARTGIGRRLEWYAARLRGYDAGFAELEARIRAAWNDGPDEGVVHGDLHFGQLFLDPDGRLSGVIDVDTVGRGAPADDSAAFVAHAVASALLTPAPRDARVWELARTALRRWDGAPGASGGMRARAA
ncbi:aminoglycoside phosphotransferase family protein, partial [Microbacterium sp. CPCC 204701]|uniref:aminoglycoside phosphotransferase family protein n=1 Tax=Microbacterium sp. CPCC 204701 TaxID=2493084 RepID=UPI0013E2FE5D